MNKETTKYNFINDDIKIDFAIPKDIQRQILKCEQYDLEDNYGSYECNLYALDSMCKMAYAQGIFTQRQWDTVMARYCF